MEMIYNSLLSNTVVADRVWLLSTWNVANMSEELNFYFYFILIYFAFMWLVATVSNNTALYTSVINIFFQYLFILFISLFLQPLFFPIAFKEL